MPTTEWGDDDEVVSPVSVPPPLAPSQDPYPNQGAPNMDLPPVAWGADDEIVPERQPEFQANQDEAQNKILYDTIRKSAKEAARGDDFKPNPNDRLNPPEVQKAVHLNNLFAKAMEGTNINPQAVEKVGGLQQFVQEYEKWKAVKPAIEAADEISRSTTKRPEMWLIQQNDPVQKQAFLDELREKWAAAPKGSYREKKSWIHAIPFVGFGLKAEEQFKLNDQIEALRDHQEGKVELPPDKLQEYTREVWGKLLTLEEMRTKGVSLESKVESGVVQALPFMLEMIATSGVAGFVKGAATKGLAQLTGSATMQGLKGAVLRGGVSAAGVAAGEAARLPFFAGMGTESYARNVAPDYTVSTDGKVEITGEGDKPATAVLKAVGSTYIELVTEQSGGAITAAGAGAGRLLGKGVSKYLPTVGKFMGKVTEKIGSAWTKATSGTAAEFVKKTMTKAGYHGVLEEIGEERLGDILRAVTGAESGGLRGDENTIKNRLLNAIPDGEQFLVEAATFGLLGGGSLAAQAGAHAAFTPKALTREEEFNKWAKENPDKAKYMAEKETLSRSAFRAITEMPGETNARERERVRQYARRFMFEESSQQPRAEEQGEPGSVSQAEGVNVPQQQEVAPRAQETGPAPVQEEPVNAVQEQTVQEAPVEEAVRPAEEANVAPGQGAETSVAQEQAPEAAPEQAAEAPPKAKPKSKGVKAKSAPGSKGVKAKPETAATEAPVKESLTVAPETTPDLTGMNSFGKDDYKAYSPIVKKQMDAEVNIRRKAMVLTSTIDKIHYQAQEAILKDAIEAHPEMVEVLQEPKRLSLDQKDMLKRILSKQAAPSAVGLSEPFLAAMREVRAESERLHQYGADRLPRGGALPVGADGVFEELTAQSLDLMLGDVARGMPITEALAKAKETLRGYNQNQNKGRDYAIQRWDQHGFDVLDKQAATLTKAAEKEAAPAQTGAPAEAKEEKKSKGVKKKPAKAAAAQEGTPKEAKEGAYRGYLIKKNPISGDVFVEKDGVLIVRPQRITVDEARKRVDELLGEQKPAVETITKKDESPRDLHERKMHQQMVDEYRHIFEGDLPARVRGGLPAAHLGHLNIKPIKTTVSLKKSKVDSLSNIMAREQGRYAINGVFHDAKENRLVATDGTKMVVLEEKIEGESRTINPKTNETIEGIFPEWQQVIPKTYDTVLIDAKTIHEAANGALKAGKLQKAPDIFMLIKGHGEKVLVNPQELVPVLQVLREQGAEQVGIGISTIGVAKGAMLVLTHKKNIAVVMGITSAAKGNDYGSRVEFDIAKGEVITRVDGGPEKSEVKPTPVEKSKGVKKTRTKAELKGPEKSKEDRVKEIEDEIFGAPQALEGEEIETTQDDGIPEEERETVIADLAEKLKLRVRRVSQIEAEGIDVESLKRVRGIAVRGNRQTEIQIKKQKTLAAELHTLGHEAIHAILNDLQAKDKYRVLSAVDELIQSGKKKIMDATQKRWGHWISGGDLAGVLGGDSAWKENAFNEILAEAGGLNLTDPEVLNTIAPHLPQTTLEKIAGVLSRIIERAKDLLGHAKKNAQVGLKSLARQLILARSQVTDWSAFAREQTLTYGPEKTVTELNAKQNERYEALDARRAAKREARIAAQEAEYEAREAQYAEGGALEALIEDVPEAERPAFLQERVSELKAMRKTAGKELQDKIDTLLNRIEKKAADLGVELKGPVEGKDLASTNVSELPKRASGAGEALSQHSIIAGMARHYDVPLRRGGLRKEKGVKLLGKFKRFAGVVRVDKDHVGDIGLMSHEVAHKLDQQYKITEDMPFTLRQELSALDYDQERNPEDMTGSVPTAVREGFAEYIRHYFWTFDNPQDYDEVASEVKRLIGEKAPTFHAFFENWVKQHPGLSAKMENTREEIYNWRRAGDLEREMKNLSRTGKAPDRRSIQERIRDLFTTNYTRWKDKGRIFDLFSRKAKDLGFVGPESVYQLYLAFDQSGPAMAARAAEHGVFKMTGKMEKIGPKFGEILEEIPLEDQDKFEVWAWARHSIECWSKDVNPGMSLAAAKNIYETHKTDAFERAAVKLTEYENAMIDMLTDVGVLEDDKVALVDGKEEIIPGEGTKMKEHWQTFLQLRRVRSIPSAGQLLSSRAVPSGKKYANLTDPIMRRVGSGDMVYSPLQSALERTQQFYTRAAQQVVINQIVEAIDTTPGMGAFAEHIMTPIKRTAIKLGDVAENLKKQYDVDLELPKGVLPETVVTMFSPDLRVQKGGKAIIRHTLNGVTSFYEVDPEFYKALTGMNFLTTPLILEPLAAIARSIRAGATGLSTIFAGGNIVRDYTTYLMQTKYGEGSTQFTEPLKQILVYAASEVDKLRGGEGDIFVELYKGMAGEMATMLGSDLRKFRKFIESQMRQPMSKKVLREMNPMNFIEMARKIINLSEVGPRLAEFEAVMKKYGITKEIARKDGVPRRILVEAINAANDVTINFKRNGSWGQFVNRYIPFFNAGLEGQDKYIRTWRDNPKRAAVGTGAMVIAQILYWLYRKDDDDYKEQPGWLKYFFWTFADANGQTWLRLPRPFEWNIIPSGVEMLLNHHESETGGEFSKWLWEMISRQTPSIKVAGATQAIETFFNFDFFRWDDIYKGDKYNKTLASKQYLDHTTETMKAIGEWTGIAPYRLEHFINSTTGGLYKKLVGTGEAVTVNAYNTIWGLPDPEKKGQSAVEIAYYNFVPLTLRKNYTQSEVDFSNELDAAERQYNASRPERGKDGDPKLKAELWRLNQYKSLISEIKGLVFQQAGRTEKFNFEKYVNGLSRQALGKENLDLYPSPFKTTDLPSEVREIRDEFLGRIIYQVTSPMKTKSPEEVEMTKERAAEWLDDLSADEKRRLLLQEARARKHGVDSIISRLGRLNRLD
jgi:hypothetical protein